MCRSQVNHCLCNLHCLSCHMIHGRGQSWCLAANSNISSVYKQYFSTQTFWSDMSTGRPFITLYKKITNHGFRYPLPFVILWYCPLPSIRVRFKVKGAFCWKVSLLMWAQNTTTSARCKTWPPGHFHLHLICWSSTKSWLRSRLWLACLTNLYLHEVSCRQNSTCKGKAPTYNAGMMPVLPLTRQEDKKHPHCSDIKLLPC